MGLRAHLFYNPLLANENDKPFVLTKHFDDKKLYTLGQAFEENVKRRMHLPHDKAMVKLFGRVHFKLTHKRNSLELRDGSPIEFEEVTQKLFYEEALMRISTDHHSQAKWATKFGLNTLIVWDDAWKSLHENCLATNRI